MTKTREMVMERQERKEMFNAERKEKRDQWKRMQDERKKQNEEYQARQEEKRKREDERKKEWELEQLSRFDVHPYKHQIEACEQLIYFCVKNKKSESKQAADIEDLKQTNDVDRKEAAEKTYDEKVKGGKIEVAQRKDFRQ